MNRRCVIQKGAVKLKGADCLRRVKQQLAVRVEQLPAACPQLQTKIIDRVVTIGIGGKDCAIKSLVRTVKKACKLVKLFPTLRRAQRYAVARLIGGLLLRVFKEVFAIN